MTKDELHGFVVKLCTDEQLDAAIKRHRNSYRCGRCNQPLGTLLVSQGKPPTMTATDKGRVATDALTLALLSMAARGERTHCSDPRHLRTMDLRSVA
jgi:hypothetical protein